MEDSFADEPEEMVKAGPELVQLNEGVAALKDI